MARYSWDMFNTFAPGEPSPYPPGKAPETGKRGSTDRDKTAPRNPGPFDPTDAPRPPVTTTTTPAPATPTPPGATPAPAEGVWANLLPQYYAGLTSFVGDPAGFYTGRGGEKQAQQDYYNMLNAWTQKAGVPLTADDWANVWANLQAYRTGYQAQAPTRTFTMSDALRYMNRMLAGAPNPVPVTFLRTGII